MSAWTVFLVRNLDPKLLKKINADARKAGRSRDDFLRSILCDYYSLDCPPSGAGERLKTGALTISLRLHPDLWAAIKEDAERSGESMQACVHEALSSRYVTT